MNNLRITLLMLLILGLGACANKENKLEEGAIASEDFLDEGGEEGLMVDDKADEEIVDTESGSESVEEMAGSTISATGEMGTYVIREGETLMQMAFKIYGDYRQWKQIMSLNNLSNPNVPGGTSLKYDKPSSEFIWSPQGNPYLVKQGDTLGLISQKKYNTVKRWRDIYDNNKPLIRDPDLIFAGFTLYYIPSNHRNTAAE